jgi:hypothetical protein
VEDKVAELACLTNRAGGAVEVLPALSYLDHRLATLPLDPASLGELGAADLVLVDATRDLLRAQALCRTMREADSEAAILVVMPEAGLAGLQPDWGASDFVLPDAGPAEVELQRLTPSTLSGFYRALLTDARRDGQGLAPKTRAQHPRDAAPGPFETPSVSATWSATWPTRRLSAVPRCPSRSILGLSNWAFASPPRVPIPRCSCQLSWMVP